MVTLHDELSDSPNTLMFEAFFTPIFYHERFTYEGEFAKRIWALEVSTRIFLEISF